MYTIARGDSRTVIAIPSLGVVIKVPRCCAEKYKRKEWAGVLHMLWREVTYVFRQPRYFLEYPGSNWRYIKFNARMFYWTTANMSPWSGIADNWRERRYSRRANSLERRLIVPTYISFLGLLNVQRYGVPSEADRHLVTYLFDSLTKRESAHGSHHFQNPANFTGLEHGYIKALDYGNLHVQRVLSKYSVRLLRRVDLVEVRRWYGVHMQRLYRK